MLHGSLINITILEDVNTSVDFFLEDSSHIDCIFFHFLKLVLLFQAFEDAWKEACSKKRSVFMVPSGRTYLVNATKFNGPCANGLIIQVIIKLISRMII